MKTVFYFLFLLLPLPIFAQQSLNGMVSDEAGKPLDAATVTLSQNGQVINNQLADQGRFSLGKLNSATYQLSVTLMGYKPIVRQFSMPKDSLKLTMQNENQQLKEVAITFRKPTIERKVDRVVFNVENSPIASGGTVYEALTKAPGVKANSDGSIMAGNKTVTIYIDDKPVRLSAEDLAAYLQSLPAENISKIEVMSNPSSRYDAQGGAVINIVSKKIKSDGFNANLNAAYIRGKRDSYRGNGIFNYRKDKLNVFGTYGYTDRNIQRDLTNYTIYQTPDAYAYWDRSRLTRSDNEAHNYKVGVDYNLTDNQVAGILVTGSNAINSSESNGLTNIYNNYRPATDSVLHTTNRNQGHTNQYSFNLNYKIKLDTAGQSLNVDLDYVPFNSANTQQVDNLSVLPDGSLGSAPYHIRTPATQKINIWSGKIDYDYKLGKVWTLESGLKYTSIVSENHFNFFNTAGAEPVFDEARSDYFRYTEKTGAAYTSISAELGKWSFKGGLRAENTSTKGYSVSLDSLNKNTYLRLFPTAFITYKLSEDQVFGINYARRIDRPGYMQLNPAKSYSTPYSYQNGNPFLRPVIFNSLELSYTLKKNYTITGVYTLTNDLASNVTVQDNVTKTFYDTQQNLGNIRDIGLQLSAVNHPFSWWEINNYAEGNSRRQQALYLNGAYENSFYYYLKSTHAFTISKNNGLKAELSGWYLSPVQQGSLHIARTYDVSAGISKPVLNKQGTIRLTAADIFYKNPYKIDVNYLDQRNGLYQQNDTRNITVSFSYKLGKSVAEARKRQTASEDERRRSN